MDLPNRKQALERAHHLARCERVTLSRNARSDSTGLGYLIGDVCDCIAEIKLHECEDVVWSDWKPDCPVLICVTTFSYDDEKTDKLYVKVQIPKDKDQDLFVLSFKLDGKPG